MSFPRVPGESENIAVRNIANDLNELCAVAFLNYTTPLKPVGSDVAEALKAASKVRDETNDKIDLIIMKRINEINPSLVIKAKTDIRDKLRTIIDKKISGRMLLSAEEDAILQQYKVDEHVLVELAQEKNVLDGAMTVLFKSPMIIPDPSNESRAARQALLSYVTLDILDGGNDKEKSVRIERWINILSAMLSDGNYYGSYVLMNALNDDKVRHVTAMDLVSVIAKDKLQQARTLFSDKKQLIADMQNKLEQNVNVIPSLHSDEGCLVQFQAGSNAAAWNKLTAHLNPYKEKLMGRNVRPVSSNFIQNLMGGKIGTDVVMTQEMQAKTITTMIEVGSEDSKIKIRSDIYFDLMSARANVVSKLESLQAYIDTVSSKDSGKSSKYIVDRINIVSHLIKEIGESLVNINSMSDRENEENIRQLLDDALSHPAVLSHKNPLAKGPTQSFKMISELSGLYAALERKNSAYRLSIPPASALPPQPAQAQSVPIKEVPHALVSNLAANTLFVGVPPSARKMKRIFHEMSQDTNLGLKGKVKLRFDIAMNILGTPNIEGMRASDLSSLPYASELASVFRDEQLEVDKLHKDIEQIKAAKKILEDLALKHPDPQSYNKLVYGFNRIVSRISRDALRITGSKQELKSLGVKGIAVEHVRPISVPITPVSAPVLVEDVEKVVIPKSADLTPQLIQLKEDFYKALAELPIAGQEKMRNRLERAFEDYLRDKTKLTSTQRSDLREFIKSLENDKQQPLENLFQELGVSYHGKQEEHSTISELIQNEIARQNQSKQLAGEFSIGNFETVAVNFFQNPYVLKEYPETQGQVIQGVFAKFLMDKEELSPGEKEMMNKFSSYLNQKRANPPTVVDRIKSRMQEVHEGILKSTHAFRIKHVVENIAIITGRDEGASQPLIVEKINPVLDINNPLHANAPFIIGPSGVKDKFKIHYFADGRTESKEFYYRDFDVYPPDAEKIRIFNQLYQDYSVRKESMPVAVPMVREAKVVEIKPVAVNKSINNDNDEILQKAETGATVKKSLWRRFKDYFVSSEPGKLGIFQKADGKIDAKRVLKFTGLVALAVVGVAALITGIVFTGGALAAVPVGAGLGAVVAAGGSAALAGIVLGAIAGVVGASGAGIIAHKAEQENQMNQVRKHIHSPGALLEALGSGTSASVVKGMHGNDQNGKAKVAPKLNERIDADLLMEEVRVQPSAVKSEVNNPAVNVSGETEQSSTKLGK